MTATTALATLTVATDDGAHKSPDGRFYAYPVPRCGYWIVKDTAGHYFLGGGGKVTSLAAADSYATAWAQDVAQNPQGRGARAGRYAIERGRSAPTAPASSPAGYGTDQHDPDTCRVCAGIPAYLVDRHR